MASIFACFSDYGKPPAQLADTQPADTQFERTEYGITIHCALCAETYETDLQTTSAASLDALRWCGWQLHECPDGYTRLTCPAHPAD